MFSLSLSKRCKYASKNSDLTSSFLVYTYAAFVSNVMNTIKVGIS